MLYNPFSLEGKTILITGASSGIGRASAIACSKMGANVVITGRNIERLQATFDQLEKGGNHIQIAGDLTVAEDLDNLVANVPVLDGLVNNAGISFTKPIGFIKKEDIQKVYESNLYAPMLLTNNLLKKKKLAKGASVVFMSSAAAFGCSNANSTYGTAKAALSDFMHYCNKEITPTKHIRFNALHPGMVRTELVANLSFTEEELQKDMARYPLGRYGEPEDIANAVIYFLSDASAWISGVSLVIDGGLMNRI
ncbi:MAG: SDR family oxidoreductase [Paludibacteraceae bacterium]|jgi:NAD(P)-dependent dehydrogenase (short-subunit alcohol dehydrogenase family)|nr:SDR family oxidoreductase [Paludibacteraceae bacterium]